MHLALQLATGRLPERGYWRVPGIVLLAGSAMLGFNYVYYAFFGCFFIVAAVVLGGLIERRRTIVLAGAVCLAVLMACSFLNLAPSLYSWSRHGKPLVVEDKVPGHAELFGLKIRTLISPVSPHLFPPFRHWGNLETVAQYPIETENSHARLGVVGATGFLGLIGILFVPSAAGRLGDGPVVLGASRLMAAGLLLATVGGFGSVFNLLVSPEIRVYARIFPFIAFFALVAVAMFHGRILQIASTPDGGCCGRALARFAGPEWRRRRHECRVRQFGFATGVTRTLRPSNGEPAAR